jgi:carbamoyl-phosphate synthase large subunit
MKVLITGINGDIGAGMSLIIREMYPKSYILGVDMDISIRKFHAANEVKQICSASSISFISVFVDLCNGFDIVLPSLEAELTVLKNVKNLNDIPIVKLANNWLTKFLSKSATAWWLQENELPAPKTAMLANIVVKDVNLPVIIKPDVGQGSRSIVIANTKSELKKYQQQLSKQNMVAQAVVGKADDEYTCAVIRLDKKTRTLVMKRSLLLGTTQRIEVVFNREIDGMLINLANKMDLQGALNVQLRLTDNGPQIFEINPRISGTLVMRHKLGFQDLFWYLEYMLKNKSLPNYDVPLGAKVVRIDGWHDYKIVMANEE